MFDVAVPIGGSHPMLYFPVQITEKYSIVLYANPSLDVIFSFFSIQPLCFPGPMQLTYTYICNNVFWSHELVTVMMPCGDCGWDKLLRYRIKWKIMRGGVRWGHRWGQIRHRFASVWGEARTQSVNGGETTSEGSGKQTFLFLKLDLLCKSPGTYMLVVGSTRRSFNSQSYRPRCPGRSCSSRPGWLWIALTINPQEVVFAHGATDQDVVDKAAALCLSLL